MYLLFDIGGTKTRIAFSKDGQTFEEPKICATHKTFADAIAEYKKFAQEVSDGVALKAAAAGVRALDKSKKKLRPQPNFPLWEEEPLQEELEQALGVPVYLENDSAIVGLGEAVAGAGKDYSIVAYITVSTGVGGARIVNKTIDTSAFGFEPGNQIIDIDGSSHVNATPLATLEQYVSGTAFEERYKKKPYEVTDPDAWEEAARILAYGIHNTMMYWSPDVIVLGGAMIVGNPVISIESVRQYLKESEHIVPDLPDIKKAALGDVGGLHGALTFLKQKMGE
jgi:predicted NBD/HSP70 family sugar kinase